MKKKLIIDPFNSMITVTFISVNFTINDKNIVTATYIISFKVTSFGYGH
jgi:hypothetical protein